MKNQTMKAVLLTGYGGFDKLEYREDVPVPEPGPGEALIRVAACGLNNTDINTRTGWYSGAVKQGNTETAGEQGYASSVESDAGWSSSPINFPRIQGADVCGIVEHVAHDPGSDLPGKRVMIDPWILAPKSPDDLSQARYFGSEIDGGYAEYTVAPVENVHVVNSRYSDEELATFACAYGTADNMLGKAEVGSGDTVVVSGASGGVGSAAVQLAKIRGAQVIAISSAGREQALRKIGADHVVCRSGDDLRARIRRLAGGEADAAVDVAGGEIFGVLIDCLKRGGRYASSGCVAGPMVELDLRKLILRDLVFKGATVIAKGGFARLVSIIEKEQVVPVVAEVYPLRELAQAQRAFMKKQHIGNIAVRVQER